MMYLAITTWLVFVVASAIAIQVIKNGEARKINRRYVDVVDDTFRSFQMTTGRIERSLEDLTKELKLANQNARLTAPKDGLRVYAVILQRGAETRLFVQPAQTFEEMVAVTTQEFGAGWSIISSAHAEVIISKKAIPAENVPITKVDTAKSSAGVFIMNLEYVRDKFATTPNQKKAVETIITNIKNHYGNSSYPA